MRAIGILWRVREEKNKSSASREGRKKAAEGKNIIARSLHKEKRPYICIVKRVHHYVIKWKWSASHGRCATQLFLQKLEEK